ncbi:TrkH family potassium uptake protein [Haloarchaeobius amylolyticus]|uniref:TrkH family potassium uptake protein n=1 Tax=Haloarchaeobius amylolyticus TaxID=1198296 RepID=UPI00226E3BB7|nr:potassium transporter TrkG [Haloarchaeobius amylolyticus]
MPRSRTVGGVPTDLAIIARDVGTLLLMQAGLMTLTVGVALVFGEFYPALGFLTAGGITALLGELARRAFADAPEPKMKHGMVIAAGGWFATAVFGALAFFLVAWMTPESVMNGFVPGGTDTSDWSVVTAGGLATKSSLGYFRNPLHAMFESMSGWTGSGLTMAIHEPSLPRSVQWWRSLIQYVGGVGVIVLTVSILSRPGSGSYALYRSEAREEKIHPSVVSTVRTVWKIFVGYTLLAVAALFLVIWLAEGYPVGEALWHALNHAMTGLSTGGFSVTDNSMETYNSPLIETVLLPVMTLGAIAFPIHYAILSDGRWRKLYEDLQTRWLFLLLGGGIVALSAQNVLVGLASAGYGATVPSPVSGLSTAQFDAIRDGTFQWVSALSCTGFQSSPIGRWSDGGKLLVSAAMTMGGAAGSTVGGIKIIRGYTVSKGIQWQFSRVFLPANAVVNVDIGDRTLGREEMDREFSEAAIVSMLWLILLLATSLVMVNVAGPDFSYADALFEVASAQGNVGLSTGITGPDMPVVAEAMFLLNMWVGRLEIIPVLVFFRSALKGLNP